MAQDENRPDDAELQERLARLSHSLDVQTGRKPGAKPEGDSERGRALGLASRVLSEFVAGVLVGGGLGWGFDWLLGTSPWGLIVLGMLGLAAGFWNVIRISRAEDKSGPSRP